MEVSDPASDEAIRAPSRRRMARIAAVQALYQIALTGRKADDVSREFARFQLGQEIEGILMDADRTYFGRIVNAVDRDREALTEAISSALTTGRAFSSLEVVLRAILLSGAGEIKTFSDIPPRVSIREYVEITDDFFGPTEAGIVNAVLDRLARVMRPDEL